MGALSLLNRLSNNPTCAGGQGGTNKLVLNATVIHSRWSVDACEGPHAGAKASHRRPFLRRFFPFLEDNPASSLWGTGGWGSTPQKKVGAQPCCHSRRPEESPPC